MKQKVWHWDQTSNETDGNYVNKERKKKRKETYNTTQDNHKEKKY